MWTQWFVAQTDYVCFIGSLAWLFVAAVCWRAREGGGRSSAAWAWLGWFGILYGTAGWLEVLAAATASPFAMPAMRTAVTASAWAALFEFGGRSNRRRAIGRGCLGFLAALAVLGWQVRGMNLETACRWALGLPGGIWAAGTLWQLARRSAGREGRALRVAAAALLVGIMPLAEFAPQTACWPVSQLHLESLWILLGRPIHSLCGWICLAALWRYAKAAVPGLDEEIPVASRGLGAAFPCLIILGWCGTAWRGSAIDAEMRQTALRQAQGMALAMPAELVRQLSFTAADQHAPAFQRLRQALIAYGEYVGLRSIYTMALRDGRIVFGPENLQPSDPLASPPGTVYQRPRPEDWECLTRGRHMVFGPFEDEYGSFVNGLAPVLDPRSGAVLAAVGVDIPVSQWQARIAAARLHAIGITLAAIAVLAGGGLVLRYRERLEGERQTWPWRHAETLLTAVMGLSLTVVLCLIVFDVERRRRRDDFHALARTKAEVVRDALGAVSERLGSVASFYEGSEDVTRQDFAAFLEPLVRLTPIDTWEWVPLVRAEDRERFEAEMRRDGVGDFRVNQTPPRGEPAPEAEPPPRFPVAYVAPLEGNEARLGRDLGADANQLAALRRAASSGLGAVGARHSGAATSPQDAQLVVFRPVFKGRVRPLGFVACELSPQILLQQALAFLGPDGGQLNMLVLEPRSGGAPVEIASHPPAGHGRQVVEGASRDTYDRTRHPVLFFDRTWAVLQWPSQAFQASHPMWLHRMAAVGGGLITLLVTLLVASLRGRQAFLEDRVRERTRALQAEHDLFVGGPTVVVLWRNAADWPIEYVSANVAQVLGYDDRELTVGGVAFPTLVHPEDWQTLAADMQAHLAGPAAPFEHEFRIRHARGEYRWFHNFTVLRRDAGGLVTHYHGYLQDITERKLAEAGLSRRDAILAAAQFAGEHFLRGQAWEATVGDVLARVGRAADASRVYVFENHLGPAGQRLTSQRYEWVAAGVEPQRENPGLQDVVCDDEVFARWAGCLERGEAVCGLVREMPAPERSVLEPQGIISLAAMPIRAYGHWWGFIGFDDCRHPRQWSQAELDALRVVADMLGAALERKHQEAAQIRSQKLESLGTLAGGIAHDFNNILHAISGNTELARLDLPPAHPVQSSLAEVTKACARAGELVRRILTFSRPHDPTRRSVALSAVVDEAIKLLRPTLPAMIELRTRFAAGLPPVLADPTQLHQIIVNLATNAAHAIGAGSGWIEFRLSEVVLTASLADAAASLRPGRYVRLAVADSGCGMDRATLERIFDPFFTTKLAGRGTGLGLSVVHGIVHSHEGRVSVDSQPGRGSTFYLDFPVADRPPPAAAEPPPAAQPTAVTVRGARILYVDDEEPLVFLATRLLQRAGHVVAGFTEAPRALHEFRSRPHDFDVVITDLAMPKMTGFDLARGVLEIRPDIPIIMTSGHVRPEDQEAAQRIGIREVVLKPSVMQQLVEILDRLVIASRSPNPTASAGP